MPPLIDQIDLADARWLADLATEQLCSETIGVKDD